MLVRILLLVGVVFTSLTLAKILMEITLRKQRILKLATVSLSRIDWLLSEGISFKKCNFNTMLWDKKYIKKKLCIILLTFLGYIWMPNMWPVRISLLLHRMCKGLSQRTWLQVSIAFCFLSNQSCSFVSLPVIGFGCCFFSLD